MQKANVIDEFFDLCKDVDGTLHPDKVRYALAYAYRGGFIEGVELYRGRLNFEPQCSVQRPRPVITTKQEELMEERARAIASTLYRGKK